MGTQICFDLCVSAVSGYPEICGSISQANRPFCSVDLTKFCEIIKFLYHICHLCYVIGLKTIKIITSMKSSCLFFAGGIVNNTLRPPVPGYCDPQWRLLMEQCWAPDPMARPCFAEIARRLRVMSAAAQSKPSK